MKINRNALLPGKRAIVVGMVSLLAVAAVWMNWNYQQKTAAEAAKETAMEYEAVDNRRIVGEDYGRNEVAAEATDLASYFDATRLSRRQARDEAVSILESTEASVTASDEAKSNASEEIAKIAENTVVEARIEGLVIAKGYEDCIAYINDNGCNVVVAADGEGFGEEDVAKIKDIVISETGLTASMIKIVEAVG